MTKKKMVYRQPSDLFIANRRKNILKRKLEGKGAVLIEGPKWCGKTTTAEQLAAGMAYM